MKSPAWKVVDWLQGQSQVLLIALGFVQVATIGVVDYFTGAEIVLSVFYLVPVSLVVWFTGSWPGAVMSAASCAAWFLADSVGGARFSSAFVPYWNAGVRLGFFLIVTVMNSLSCCRRWDLRRPGWRLTRFRGTF